jgi:hypothetical protein
VNGFLVLIRCMAADVPVFLTISYVEAEAVAARAIENPKTILDALDIDRQGGTPHAVEIIVFCGGHPVRQLAAFGAGAVAAYPATW